MVGYLTLNWFLAKFCKTKCKKKAVKPQIRGRCRSSNMSSLNSGVEYPSCQWVWNQWRPSNSLSNGDNRTSSTSSDSLKVSGRQFKSSRANTGCTMDCLVGNAGNLPITWMLSSDIPISSTVSRTAVAIRSLLSWNGHNLPPGKHTSYLWEANWADLNVNNTEGRCSWFKQNGIRTAAWDNVFGFLKDELALLLVEMLFWKAFPSNFALPVNPSKQFLMFCSDIKFNVSIAVDCGSDALVTNDFCFD